MQDQDTSLSVPDRPSHPGRPISQLDLIRVVCPDALGGQVRVKLGFDSRRRTRVPQPSPVPLPLGKYRRRRGARLSRGLVAPSPRPGYGYAAESHEVRVAGRPATRAAAHVVRVGAFASPVDKETQGRKRASNQADCGLNIGPKDDIADVDCL